MLEPLKQIKLKMPTLEEGQLITASAQSDPDALPLADEQMNAIVQMRTMEPQGTQSSGHCVASLICGYRTREPRLS